MSQTFIKDLFNHVGEVFTGYLLLRDVQYKTTKTEKPYVSCIFQDPSGDINGKWWDKQADTFTIKPGEIVKISANIESYKEEAQLRLINVEQLAEDNPMNKPEFYLKSAPIDQIHMQDYFNQVISSISVNHPMYANLINYLLAKEPLGNKFLTQPAAKTIHHSFYSGLAYHTYRMLQHGEKLCEVYTNLNKDLLCTSILIHDAGKMLELADYVEPNYTVPGTLLGHISIVNNWMIEFAILNQIDYQNDEDFMLLQHMVLAHHGKFEFGSPAIPHIPEAYALHTIDELDARLMIFETKLDGLKPGELSDRTFGLDNASVYKPLYNED